MSTQPIQPNPPEDLGKRAKLEAFLDQVPDALIFAAAGRRAIQMRGKNPNANKGGRPKIRHHCPYCEKMGTFVSFGVREMREHVREAHPWLPHPDRAHKTGGRRKQLSVCEFCPKRFGVVDMRKHRTQDHADIMQARKYPGRPKGSKNKKKRGTKKWW
jgi:hypothetical protein